MKILQICWYKVLPAITGGQKGIIGLYNALQKKYTTTLLCSKNNTTNDSNVQAYLAMGRRQLFGYNNYRIIKQQIVLQQPNIVILEHPYYFLISRWCRKLKVKLVIHTHNIEYRRLQKIGKWYWPLVKLIEAKAYKSADVIWCKTAEDKIFIEQKYGLLSTIVNVLPYGIEQTRSFAEKQNAVVKLQQQYGLSANTKIILFAASFDYKPNVAALHHLIFTLLPKLNETQKNDFALVICGTHLDEYTTNNRLPLPNNCIIAGFVKDITTYLAGTHLFINPVQYGEGVQTKTLDALAHHCDVVGYTSIGHGLASNDLKNKLMLANDEISFVEAVHHFLSKDLTETSMSFFEYHNWDINVSKLLTQLT